MELLIKCIKSNKPVIISTGMATMKEVSQTIKFVKKFKNKKITILHCVSSYPAKYKYVNLSVIGMLREKFNINVGWSDHTVNSNVITRAIYKWNVRDIELHYDLDRKGYEFGNGHCWLPKQASELIKNINEGLLSDGKNLKRPTKPEMQDRLWRTDTSDGLRPFIKIRKKWLKKRF